MLSPKAEKCLDSAIRRAQSAKHEFVTPEHLLLSILEDESVLALIQHLGVKKSQIIQPLEAHLNDKVPHIQDEGQIPQVTHSLKRVIQRAVIQVQSAGKPLVEVGHILIAFFDERESFATYYLHQAGVGRFDVVSFFSHGPRLQASLLPSQTKTSADSDENFAAATALSKYTINLNERALTGKVDRLIGRDKELNRVIQTLGRRTKNNPLLVGDPGVGKTAIAEGLALMVVQAKVPDFLKSAQIHTLDMGLLLAGTKFRGEFEERLKQVVEEITHLEKGILFIDEIHTLIGAGGTQGGSLDASNLLKPALSSGELSCIGSTTVKDFRMHFEKDAALARRFQRIDVHEPSSDECFEILKGIRPAYEAFHKVKYSDEALKSAIELSTKFLRERRLPDKAIDLLDEAGSKNRIFGQEGRVVTITEKEIESVLSQVARIPERALQSNDKEKLKTLEQNLKLLIFGQDEAVTLLASSIKLSRSGLGHANKPVGSFLFAGPTGVGKTELAKQLAHTLGLKFLRYDMSEYMEKHAVSRLIGAPPGYVGYDEGGLLTEAIHQNPHSVLLLDEIEKAHPDLVQILLQVMDSGQLTDTNGRASDFRNVILIMTSNAGAREAAKSEVGIISGTAQARFMEAVKRQFNPEFINRLDAIVPFNNLDEAIIIQVVEKFIMEFQQQLQDKKVELAVERSAQEWLMKKGYDPVMGARPMSRVITNELRTPLVEEILFGNLQNGGRVVVSLKDDRLDFTFEEASGRDSKKKKARENSATKESVKK
ncbi:MAG: ATP-dependent Clp protease ATP-binding subunit ClpA [Bdellovibrionales bacterium CG10_big_fil_rev_8_21_14_0_10_45_34]|nr:MAG: ATP-dependent Clp protease ATP-binding subunit ClpA [Bdellovibrionales bacterium CG10_big_fil_rev_8_21_14_0_10_45_34]